MQALAFLRNYWKEALILVLLAVVNWYRVRPQPVVTHTEYRNQIQTVQVEKKDLKKTVVQTVNKKKGTQVIQTTVIDHGTVQTDESQDDTGTAEEAPSNPYDPARYQVDVTTNPVNYKDWKVGVGARLGDLPAFGVLEYEPGSKTVRLGVRVEH